MSKLQEIKGKIDGFISQIREKLRSHPILAKFFAPKEKKPVDPNSPTVLFREGSLFTRFQLTAVLLLLLGAVAGVWFSGKLIFERMQENKSLQAESEQYKKEFEEFTQRVKENASIISLGSFTLNSLNHKGESVRVSLDLWARFSDPETAGYADAIAIKINDRVSAALARVTEANFSIFTENGKDTAKAEIKRQVGPLLRQGKILDVYFHNLVAQ